MKAAVAVALALLMLYGVDQYFNYGHVTDPLLSMLRDMRHGFGL